MPIDTNVKVNGYIKVFRSFLGWQWFQKPEMVQIWIYLLLKANHQDGFWQGMPVKRGQLLTGRKKISVETGLSEMTIRTCLNKLKSTNEITVETTNRFSLITIVKWDDFQNEEPINQPTTNQQANQQLTNKQPAANQQLTTNKNDKNVKNDKNIKTYIGVITNYTENEELKESLKSFVEMRQKMKGFTIHALELALKHLDELAFTDNEKRDIVNQSVEQSWKSFYPIRSKKNKNIDREELPF